MDLLWSEHFEDPYPTPVRSFILWVISDNVNRLKKILDEAGQDRESIARNVVDALNEQLSTKEIEEVNELLIWVVFAREYFDVDKLKAALVSQICLLQRPYLQLAVPYHSNWALKSQ
jgi:hypothetical protein